MIAQRLLQATLGRAFAVVVGLVAAVLLVDTLLLDGSSGRARLEPPYDGCIAL